MNLSVGCCWWTGIWPAQSMIHTDMSAPSFPWVGRLREQNEKSCRDLLMRTFKKEIESILAQLMGSSWAPHAGVQDVIAEYQHFVGAAKTPNQTRRVSLQIFHASRAIDSFLAHVAGNEAAKPGSAAAPAYWTLGKSLNYIRTNSISGSRFTPPTDTDLTLLKDDRNEYLHRANNFPTDGDIRRFLTRTTSGIKEATTFPT
jgi:hypothetical protein